MSWRVEIVEVLNKENDFEGEEWWAVTDDNKMENTFEVRNEQVAKDLCKLLNSKEEEYSMLQIDLGCLSSAIEKTSYDFKLSHDVLQSMTDHYEEMLEGRGVCSHLEEISLMNVQKKLI